MTGGGERMARMKQKETKAELSADSGPPPSKRSLPYVFLQVMVKE